MPPPDSLYAQLLRLPVGAALVLPLGIGTDSAQRAIKTVIELYDNRRRFAIGEHIARPRQGETLHHMRIERLPDEP